MTALDLSNAQAARDLTVRAVAAARAAGAAILDVYRGAFDVEQKADRTPITEADRRSTAVIEETLAATGLPMLSEERPQAPYETRRSWPWFWLVDPLDGTKEFVGRNGEFTVNIALIHEGAPWAGVVYAPVTGETAFACRGWAAWFMSLAPSGSPDGISWERLAAAATRLPEPSVPRPFTVAASRSHLSEKTRAHIEGLRRRHPDLRLVSRGSALKFVMVARGQVDCYPRFDPTMEWDTAAGHAVIAEAGGSVADADSGEELQYNTPGFVNPSFIARPGATTGKGQGEEA